MSFHGFYSPPKSKSPYHEMVEKKYGEESAWAKAVRQNLEGWGFNTIGVDSSNYLKKAQKPYTVLLDMAKQAGGNAYQGRFPDVFSRRFEKTAWRVAHSKCRPRRDDIYLLGYFTDTNLFWGVNQYRRSSLLMDYLQLPAESPGKVEAMAFLKLKYDTIAQFNTAWNIKMENFGTITLPKSHSPTQKQREDEEAFLEIVARRYFRVCRQEIHEEDPNHLILGCRFDELAPAPVLRGMRDYVDVVSIDTYQFPPPLKRLQRIYSITRKPVLISAFSFKAADAGLPNTKGKGHIYESQQDRANGYHLFVNQVMKFPFVIGYHWFSYCDQPASGDWNGENNNYGLVNNHDEPWRQLTEQAQKTNQMVETIHQTNAKAP
ncbi:hypothetical protein GF373_06450 [bacterium]|nr:hypothetical protein [bacterium]